ncbi:uncharacterized protein V1513DRAFT_443223 [Lipomyces chichibuensis]|uniref:uncharacterized protein n=1 Tax=Lipomyces chichibuensis TaxID=1546026 RepID=UPI003343EEE0
MRQRVWWSSRHSSIHINYISRKSAWRELRVRERISPPRWRQQDGLWANIDDYKNADVLSRIQVAPYPDEINEKVKEYVTFLDAVRDNAEREIAQQPRWKRPYRKFIVPGQNIEWKAYPWLIRRIRRKIQLAFQKREGDKLVDQYGRVFTSTWRIPSSILKKTSKPQCMQPSLQSEEFVPGGCDMAGFIQRERLVLPSRPQASQQPTRYKLMRAAYIDELVRIFSNSKPPSLPVSPYNSRGKLRLLDVLSGKVADLTPPTAPHTDLVSLPSYSTWAGNRHNPSYSLEWMTISTMCIPIREHDHMDIFSPFRGEKSGRMVTHEVHYRLSQKRYTVDDLDRWIRCASAPTAHEAFKVMEDAAVWPTFLINFTLNRKLTRNGTIRMMRVIANHFGKIDKRSQMIVFIRMSRHLARMNPGMLPRLCDIFVKQANHVLRTTFIYNKLLAVMSFPKKAYLPSRAISIIAAQKVVLSDMAKWDITLSRMGYLSLANVVQAESPTMAARVLDVMTSKGYQLRRLGMTIKAMLGMKQSDRQLIPYLPRQDNTKDILNIYLAESVYDASLAFDKIADKDTLAWSALLTKISSINRFSDDQALAIWDQMLKSGVEVNTFIVHIIMRSITKVDNAVKILKDIHKLGMLVTSSIMLEFVRCCNRDIANIAAMNIARLFVRRLRPRDLMIRSLIRHIELKRAKAVREGMKEVAAAQSAAVDWQTQMQTNTTLKAESPDSESSPKEEFEAMRSERNPAQSSYEQGSFTWETNHLKHG